MEDILPINEMVVKIASRCNINCTYCYMYNQEDKTYKIQPKFMDKEVITELMEKVQLNSFLSGVTEFTFDLHGGEPLLADIELITYFFEEAKNILAPDITPIFKLQTNAILITDEWCELFAKYSVGVGISLDGTREVNDRFRIDHKGQGTFDRTIAGIKTLLNNKTCAEIGLKPTILMVVDPTTDFRETYKMLTDLGVNTLNLLLPDYHHGNFPKDQENAFKTWLANAFTHWYEDQNSEKLKISLFDGLTKMLLGMEQTSEYWGSDLLLMMVTETNGDLEAGDALKICGEGFTKTKFNVTRNQLEDAMENELIRSYVNSKRELPAACSGCHLKDICGGGFFPHRYSKENGFNNASVYCQVISGLIVHIQNRLVDDLPDDLLKSLEVDRLTLEEVQESQTVTP